MMFADFSLILILTEVAIAFCLRPKSSPNNEPCTSRAGISIADTVEFRRPGSSKTIEDPEPSGSSYVPDVTDSSESINIALAVDPLMEEQSCSSSRDSRTMYGYFQNAVATIRNKWILCKQNVRRGCKEIEERIMLALLVQSMQKTLQPCDVVVKGCYINGVPVIKINQKPTRQNNSNTARN